MYDAFISYSSKDKRFAKHLAKSLMEKGVNVWFDRWEMKPGESLIEKISEAIHKSSYLFALFLEVAHRTLTVVERHLIARRAEEFNSNIDV